MSAGSAVQSDVTTLLARLRRGEERALGQLIPIVYPELRRIAARQLGRVGSRQTLNATEIVHSAYLKLVGAERLDLKDRAHFFAVAAKAMREILVDRIRRRMAEKRGGDQQAVTLGQADSAEDNQAQLSPEGLLDLDEALRELEGLEPRLARVVECQFFGGMEQAEIALALGVTDRTVRRDWVKARAWLHRRLRAS